MILISRNKFENSKDYWFSMVTVVFLPIILFGGYKFFLEDIIYNSSFNRENPSSFLDIQRNIKVIIRSISSVTTGLVKNIFRAVGAIRFYSFGDILLLLFSNIFFIIGIKKASLKIDNLRGIFLVSLLGFCLANVIYVLSEYFPTIYGYRNRTMAMPKLFLGLLFVSFIFLIAKYHKATAKLVLSVGIILFSIFAVSVKNAWVYANEYNNMLFQKTKDLIQTTQNTSDIHSIVLFYNRDSVLIHDKKFILKEQIYQSYYETPKLSEINKMGTYTGFPVVNKKDIKNISSKRKEELPESTQFPYFYVEPLGNKIFVIRNEEDFIKIVPND